MPGMAGPGVIPQDRTVFDPERQKIFCEHFAKTGAWHESSSVAGISYRTVRRFLAGDDEFREAVRMARSQHVEMIEKAILRRGVIGWFDETVVKDKGTGIETSKTRRYHASDKLLLAYARRHSKAYRNVPFGPQITVTNTNTQVNVAAFDSMDEGQRGALRAFLESVKAARQVETVETDEEAAAAADEAADGNANGHENGNGTNGHSS